MLRASHLQFYNWSTHDRPGQAHRRTIGFDIVQATDITPKTEGEERDQLTVARRQHMQLHAIVKPFRTGG
jgi:hypothetical protein